MNTISISDSDIEKSLKTNRICKVKIKDVDKSEYNKKFPSLNRIFKVRNDLYGQVISKITEKNKGNNVNGIIKIKLISESDLNSSSKDKKTL